MRDPVRSKIVCVGWLAVLMAHTPIVAEPVVEQIFKLQKEAIACPNKESAFDKLDQAEGLLRRSRGAFDRLEYDFQDSEMARTRALVCIALWQRNRKDTRLRDEGRGWLTKVLDNYERLAQHYENEADAIEQKLGVSELERHKRYKTVVGNISRANYKKAWTEYVLGISTDKPDDREGHLNRALDKFLSLTANGYRNDPIVADCFVGRARCLYELKRYFEVTVLLESDKITASNTTPDVFKRVTELRIKAYQALSRHLEAEDCALLYFDSLPDDPTLDVTELEMAVAWARSLAILLGNPDLNRFHGTYEKRVEKVGKWLSSYGEPWRSKLARVLSDSGVESPIGGLERAREHFGQKRYKDAWREAEAGLEAASKTTGAQDLCAELRYIRFAARWNGGSWPQAHRAAADFLRRHPKDRRAADICRMAIRSGIMALDASPSLDAATLLQFLEFAEKNFPHVPEVQKAPWYKGHLLLQEGRYPAAKEILEAITPDSPVYRQAQLDLARICLKQAEVAEKAREGHTKDLAVLYVGAADALGRFADKTIEPGSEADAAEARSALELAVAIADQLLRLDSSDPNAVLAFIERIEPLHDIAGKSESRLLAVRIEAQLLAGDTDAALDGIDDLLEHEPSDPHVAQAVVNISHRLEQIRPGSAGSEAQAEAVDGMLVRAYIFLLNHIDKSKVEEMRARKSAVRLCLADCYVRMQNPSQAINHYQWCVNNTPTQKVGGAIRGLAMAYEQTARYDLAVQQWRTLYTRMERRTNEWIEAGYHLIWCHIRAGNHERASQVLAQFRMLCPRSELGEWDLKFEALETECAAARVSIKP